MISSEHRINVRIDHGHVYSVSAVTLHPCCPADRQVETNAENLNKAKRIHFVRIHILGSEPGKLGFYAELVGFFADLEREYQGPSNFSRKRVEPGSSETQTS